MKKLTLILVLFIVISHIYAQKNTCSPGYWLYKGTIDGNSVSLYLKIMDNDCHGELDPIGIYKYDNQKTWTALSMTMTKKQEFCMIECPYTGVWIMKKEDSSLSGIWMSPDRKKLLPVKLEQAILAPSLKKELEETLDQVFAELNDC